MNEPILKVDSVSVEKNGHLILDRVSFEVERGDTIAIIGPNGAGKSTLFKALLGIIPFEGTIKWMDKVKIGYVPQKLYVEHDLPLTTLEFMGLKDGNFNNIKSALYSVGLNDKDKYTDSFERHILKSRIGDLSGGEFQRVLIAWSLLGNPNILLFDEPTSGVDTAGKDTIYGMLDKLKKERDLTIVFISHELEVVEKHTNKVLLLNKRSVGFGPLIKVASKEVLDKLFNEHVHLHKRK